MKNKLKTDSVTVLLPLSCLEKQMEGSHFPSCPLHEQSPQTPSCGAAHPPPSPVTQTHECKY